MGIEVKRTHQREALRCIVVGQRIVIGEPAVALADERLQNIFLVGIEIRFGEILSVGSQNRREGSELKPAHIKLGIVGSGRINGETSDIVAHISESAKAGIEHDRHLRLQSAPRTADVGRPREDAVALQAGSAAAHHCHQTGVGIFFLIQFIYYRAPVIAVEIVILTGGQAIGMASVLGMHLGFAEIAPPSADTFIGKLFQT